MPTILITGANRGMGLEFARQYAAEGWRVLGTVRDPMGGRALSEAGGEVYVCDVADPNQVARLKASLAGVGLDILLNNAGIYGESQGFGKVEATAFLDVIRVDTLGPLLVTQALDANLNRNAIVAAISSGTGSIANNTTGGQFPYAYRAAKAALNMVMKSLSVDLAPRGIRTVALSPGWVRTDMGGPDAPLDATTAVTGMRKVLATLDAKDSGAFIHYDGSHVPW